MCGIAGIFAARPAAGMTQVASRMLDLISHRGPDDCQVVPFVDFRRANPSGPVSIVLGHRRLAIQDLSIAARQPMSDDRGRYWLVYNGEIYNFPEIRKDLERQGSVLRSSGDTEVLLELLRREGLGCLGALDGMFAFLLLDVAERRLHVVRDRFGIKPLYYWRTPEQSIVFASEIKQFTAHPGWKPRWNGSRAYDFLSRGLIDHTSETLFAGVQQILPGHHGVVRLDEKDMRLDLHAWYRSSSERLATSHESDPVHFRGLLRESVKRRLRADVTVGACLSGGLDSSSIVCLVGEERRTRSLAAPFKTFTARHPAPALDEWPFAKEVAASACVESRPVTPRGDRLFSELSDLIWIQDEPFASTSIYAQYCVFQDAASQRVRVMLDGQGADEQLAGYHSFFKVYLFELLRSRRFRDFHYWLQTVHREYGYSYPHIFTRVLAAGLPAGVATRLYRLAKPRELLNAERLGARHGDPLLAAEGRRRGVREFSLEQVRATSLPMLLHWEDRNSMAHSVEARLPFLFHELVEYVLTLPPEARLACGWTKKILRDAFRGTMPESVRLRRDKVAFETPESSWLTKDHPGSTEALQSSFDALGDLITQRGRRYLRAVIDGNVPYDRAVWRVICFGAWMRRFGLDSRASA